LYAHFESGVGSLHGRMPAAVDQAKVKDWMDRMRPSLNTDFRDGITVTGG
jgi:hypothetical protein